MEQRIPADPLTPIRFRGSVRSYSVFQNQAPVFRASTTFSPPTLPCFCYSQETRLVEQRIPADPANPASRETVLAQAGQVRLPCGVNPAGFNRVVVRVHP